MLSNAFTDDMLPNIIFDVGLSGFRKKLKNNEVCTPRTSIKSKTPFDVHIYRKSVKPLRYIFKTRDYYLTGANIISEKRP